MAKKKKQATANKTVKKATKKSRNQSRKNTKPAWWKDTKVLICVVAILVVTFIAFIPALDNGFINTWDDHQYVTENAAVKSLEAQNIKLLFTEAVASNYHPLTMITLAFNYTISALDPFSYHLLSLLIHVVNTFFVFYFIFLLSGRKWQVAGITAFLFGIHPMHVESVAWISERKDVLYTFFFMPALIYYWKYIKENNKKYLVFTFIFFLLSCLSKPAAVVLPIVLLLIDWYGGRLPLQPSKIKWSVVLEKIPFLLLAIIFGIATIKIQAAEAVDDIGNTGLGEKLMYASYGLMMYTAKFFVPLKLTTFYPYPPTNNIPIQYYIAPVIALLISGLALASIRKTKVGVFGFAFFMITIILVLQFVSVGMVVMSERYTYVPYIGYGFMVGMLYYYLMYDYKPALAKGVKYGLTGVLFAWLIALTIGTYVRCDAWKDSETLWTDVIEKFPRKSPVPYANRAMFYGKEKQVDKALADYNTALEIKPDYYTAYNSRGNLYYETNKYPEAVKDYNEAIKLNPTEDDAYANRAIIFNYTKRYEEGLKDINKALEIDASNVHGYLTRAVILSALNQHEKAIKDYTHYLKYEPQNDQAYGARGSSYQRLQNHKAAIKDFDKAIQLNPKINHYKKSRAASQNALGK